MKKKTGVSVNKTNLLDKKIKTDFKKIFTSFSKSAIMYFAGKPESAIKESISIIESFKFSSDPSDLAYQLILTSLINSAHNLSEENRHRFVARLEDAEKLYDDKEYVMFLNGITDLIEEKEIVLEFEMLENPRSIPILQEFKAYFSRYLTLFGIPENDANLIGNRLPSYFVFELNDEWRSNFSKYEPLIQKLNAPTADAARKERQWEAYNTYLEREIEKPVFGESFSLKDIFISLRAYYKVKSKDQEKKIKVEKIAVKLEKSLDNWLKSNKPEDTIKVIQGGPGSGKSSFVKWWTGKLAKNRTIPVLFFPLHHFNIHTSIKAAIGEYFKDSSNIPLDFNPLEDSQITEKMLLVFDGLDELVMQGKSSKETANAFMQELKDFCRLKNEGKKRIQVLITGRPIAVQDTEVKLRDGDQQILFILPYYLKKSQIEEYKDINKILKKDQRNEWWNRFFIFKGLSNHNLPTALKNDGMDKITAEPLLNYLVALSWKVAPEKFNKNTNINDVYYQLILGVYNREYDNKRKYRAIGDLTSDDFIQILEEIAICAWQGGDARVTTNRKIEKHIYDRGLGSLLEEYKTSAKGGGISRLLTAFYFRKFGKEDNEHNDDTFEFTHKSFGEYLAARAIVELIAATNEEREENKQKATSRRDKRKGWTIQQALGEWLRMTAKNPIDEDLNQFIINEIKIRKEKGENIAQWQTTLCQLINEVIDTGMPLHLQEQRPNQLEEMRLARNSEEALFVALANCSLSTNKLSSINLGNSRATVWLNRLSTSTDYSDFAFKNMINLDLKGVVLMGVNFMNSNFKNSDLTKASLQASFFFQANLSNVNLSNAFLYLASLTLSNLTGANLINASLRMANLSSANLHNADLNNSDLSNSDFTNADLTNANLTNANLTNADLTNANLTNADLTNADLTNADLTNANLTNVDLTNAKVNYKILSVSKSLYKAEGIPTHIIKQIKERKPAMLKKHDE